MNKTETKELFSRVQINWGLKTLSPAAEAESLKVWHRYLQHVPYENASRVVDSRALAGGFPPRPAEIFTAVYTANGAAPPSPQQALIDAKKLTEAIQHGTPVPSVAPLVSQTLADVGVQRDDIFIKLYEERRRNALSQLISTVATREDGETAPN